MFLDAIMPREFGKIYRERPFISRGCAVIRRISASTIEQVPTLRVRCFSLRRYRRISGK